MVFNFMHLSVCPTPPPPPPPPRIEAAVAERITHWICMPQDVSPYFRRYGELSTGFYTECHNNSIALRPGM